MLHLHEMDLRLATKIYLIVQNPKQVSHLSFTVTVTRGTFLKNWSNLRNMPLSRILESHVTVSVLEAVDVHLLEKKCLWLLQNTFLCKSTNYSRARYKYSFLRYWFLFKINGVKSFLAEFLKIWRLNLGSCDPKFDVFW